jgi:hypothetical protein
MLKSPRVNLFVRRGNRLRGEAQNRVKPAHRVEAAIEAEDVLVQVGLQMLHLDASVMRPKYPRLQVRENLVDHRKVFIRVRGVAVHDHRIVLVSQVGQFVIARATVAKNRRRRDVLFDELGEYIAGTIGDHLQAQASRVRFLLSRSALDLLDVFFHEFLGTDFNRADHERLVMDALAFAARRTADERLVNLDRPFRADLIAIRANHAATELVKHRERRLTAREPELALKLCGGNARRLRRHQIRCPKPSRERGARVLHRGPGGKGNIAPASAAPHDYAGAVLHAPGIRVKTALGARKALGPTHGFQVLRAGRVVREELLKLWERRGVRGFFHVSMVAKTSGGVNGSSIDRICRSVYIEVSSFSSFLMIAMST